MKVRYITLNDIFSTNDFQGDLAKALSAWGEYRLRHVAKWQLTALAFTVPCAVAFWMFLSHLLGPAFVSRQFKAAGVFLLFTMSLALIVIQVNWMVAHRKLPNLGKVER